jgi:hypothetical protein
LENLEMYTNLIKFKLWEDYQYISW